MTFQRESRYIVVKLKDLALGQEADIREHLTELSAQPVDSLVIERDWPEYEPAWRMIQSRVEGATLSPAHIEDGEEVEVVAWQHPQYPERLMTADHKAYNESRGGAPATVAKPYTVALMTVAQHQRIVADLKVNLAMAMDAATKGDVARQQCGGMEMEIAELRAALSAPPAAGVPIGMACKINGYWEAQLFAGHGCIDRQSLYAHPLPPADVPTGLAHRLLKAYDHGDTGAIEAAIEDIRTMLAAAPTPPASEQQRAVVMPERKAPFEGADGPPDWRPLKNAEVSGWNACLAEFLRLNPHLTKGEGV